MKKQTKRIVWTKKSCSFLRQHKKAQSKTNTAHRCVYMSFQVIVFHCKWNTEHTQADKQNKNLNEKNKQTVIKERIQK